MQWSSHWVANVTIIPTPSITKMLNTEMLNVNDVMEPMDLKESFKRLQLYKARSHRENKNSIKKHSDKASSRKGNKSPRDDEKSYEAQEKMKKCEKVHLNPLVMPKRKSDLSKNTRKAKSQRLQRENESQEDRESRLTNCRLRISMSRSNECSSERNERLQLDRTRHSLLRSRKSLKSREQRLENDRIRHAISRSLESDDSRKQRLENDRIRHAVSRSQESDDSRGNRLEDDDVARSRPRVENSREQRLEDDRIRHAVSQTLESDDS
ncbi:hypothetical protein TNIN_223701 [Trichonephila inaurata madagascariensis]|uniref:Uncharacterized protein n=1 Tax=Trichonephila inaurata madagascariensis TaxID=2747483 RepID=A0A8X7BWN4_9ARAC|nr:hypothetical protein TNIN_223701 [Trichonephila inaurata madagascariensis]